MAETLKPADAEQVCEAVAAALAGGTPLELAGGASKRGLGRPMQTGKLLDLSALSGVTLYEPEELVLTAGAGTRLAEIEQLLAKERQELSFEPPDLAALYGGQAGRQTIGGIIACNLAGPRRIKAGAARDHFLGLKAVNGRGEAFKSGGRVVKNVTGYDLAKLLAGSHGTLAALTEITVKVMPAPEKIRTVLVLGLDAGAAAAVMCEALGSPHEVSGAAHLPKALAGRSAVGYVAGADAAVTAIRVEGFAPSVEHRAGALKAMFAARGTGVEELHGKNSAAFWREVGNVVAFMGAGEDPVWRLSVAPTAGPEVVARLAESAPVSAYYDWGGGLVWLTLSEAAEDGAEDAGAAAVRQALAPAGGHATLIRAPAPVRAAVAVFEPQPGPLAALTARVKSSFDPAAILNPGRMYPGV